MNVSITRPSTTPYLKMCIYGDPGVGKTTLAATAPNPLIIDIDRGLMALAGQYVQVAELGLDIGTVSIVKELEEVYKLLIGGDIDCESIVIDTVTELQRRLMDQLLYDSFAINSLKDRDVAALQDWGKNTAQTRRFLRAIRDLPKHIIFVAQGQQYEDELTGMVPRRQPALTKSLRADFMAMVDVIGCLAVKETDNSKDARILATSPTGMSHAKDRSGKLGKLIENPTIPGIINMIWGKEKQDE